MRRLCGIRRLYAVNQHLLHHFAENIVLAHIGIVGVENSVGFKGGALHAASVGRLVEGFLTGRVVIGEKNASGVFRQHGIVRGFKDGGQNLLYAVKRRRNVTRRRKRKLCRVFARAHKLKERHGQFGILRVFAQCIVVIAGKLQLRSIIAGRNFANRIFVQQVGRLVINARYDAALIERNGCLAGAERSNLIAVAVGSDSRRAVLSKLLVKLQSLDNVFGIQRGL